MANAFGGPTIEREVRVFDERVGRERPRICAGLDESRVVANTQQRARVARKLREARLNARDEIEFASIRNSSRIVRVLAHCAKIRSISLATSASILTFKAPKFSSSCSTRVAPKITLETPGCAATHASAS